MPATITRALLQCLLVLVSLAGVVRAGAGGCEGGPDITATLKAISHPERKLDRERDLEEEEHAYAVFRSGSIRPKIWQKSLSNRARVDHEEDFVYFTVPKDYASSTPGPGSMGKKAKGAGAARHAFRMDMVVVKYADEDEMEFEVVVKDAMHGGRECFKDTVEIELFGPIGVEREH